MSTYKLILVDPVNVKLDTLATSCKGLPIGIVIVNNLPKPFIQVIDTGLEVKKVGKIRKLINKYI